MKHTLITCVRAAGRVLLRHFGRIRRVTRKEHPGSIVTAADLASEKLIADIIRRRHPAHNLLGEESGFDQRGSDITWVIDPLDGTSNFAASLPWFGVMLAVLERGAPILAAMYLPVDDVLYFAERGQGVRRNGRRVHLTSATHLHDTLIIYGMDGGPAAGPSGKAVTLFSLLVNRTRNVRLTNCLLDFCYTLDGRLGGAINQNCKIWDIAPACLMFPEAGGRLTDLQGRPIKLELHPDRFLRNYPVIAAKPVLHRQLLALARQAGF